MYSYSCMFKSYKAKDFKGPNNVKENSTFVNMLCSSLCMCIYIYTHFYAFSYASFAPKIILNPPGMQILKIHIPLGLLWHAYSSKN